MRRKQNIAMMLLLLGTLQGCNYFGGQRTFESEKARLATAIADEYKAWTFTTSTLITLNKAGLLSDKDFVKTGKPIRQGKKTLDDANTALLAGNVTMAKYHLSLLARITGHLNALIPPTPRKED